VYLREDRKPSKISNPLTGFAYLDAMVPRREVLQRSRNKHLKARCG
jgi:hypothetical protein